MKIGINLLLWTPSVTEEHFGLFGELKKFGFDGVEIPMFDGDENRYRKLGQALKDNGMGSATCSVIPDEEHNPISSDAKNRQAGIDYMKWVIDCSAAMGSEIIAGPFYQPLAQFSGQPPTEKERETGIKAHRVIADYAQQANILLAVEFLNRFECYFLNTTHDAAEYARKVDRPNFGILYDTFHANIEEKDPVACITKDIDMISHVHVAENDRGTPGTGHVPWAETFKALRKGGYDKWLVIEAFSRALPELAAATRIWRDVSGSYEEVCTQGYKLITDLWAKAG